MGTSKETIRHWLDEGTEEGATHVIVACDTLDYEDYPVFVEPGQDPKEIAKQHDGPNMTRLMEVYSLTGKHTVEDQLNASRVFNYD